MECKSQPYRGAMLTEEAKSQNNPYARIVTQGLSIRHLLGLEESFELRLV